MQHGWRAMLHVVYAEIDRKSQPRDWSSCPIVCMIKPNESIKKGAIGLKTLRQLLGEISQEELGRRISASVKTISRWEGGGKAQLSIPQIKALETELESVGLKFSDLSDDLSLNSK